MCGILYARLKDDHDPRFPRIFQEAINLMAYRGRDNIGYFQALNNYFGHARLSILDLSSHSNQPLVNKDNILLFKGEIYNYKQLKASAASDTLAISELVEEGIDISNILSGMYAILIYNKSRQDVKILRDFYGEKPVYYYSDDRIFIVSSTIKSINHILIETFGKKLKINSIALYEYFLCGYVREPKTLYENIHMLSSGHELIFSSEWSLKINNLFANLVDNKLLNAKMYAKNALQNTDVEPGLLLSSGVDSTYLLNLMNDDFDSFKVLTYKTQIPEQDESARAVVNVKKICKDKNISINIIENHENLLALYAKYPTILELPTSDGMQLFNMLSVSRELDAKLRLIILGTGGDELYGGYNSFKNYKNISLLRRFSYFKKLLPIRYRRFFEIQSNADNAVASYYFLYRICYKFISHVPGAMLNQIFSDFMEEMKKYGLSGLKNPHQKIKLFESFDYMRNQLLRDTDNISLYCGYEARSPLLSVAHFSHQLDNKKSMKKELWEKYDIKFTGKKGFTFSQDELSIFNYLYQKIEVYNKKYNLISKEILSKLTPSDPALLRKIYILLAWLESNKIEADQIQGITI